MVLPQTRTLLWQVSDEVPVIKIPAFEKLSYVRHGISTRLGGVSGGIYKSMNLSFTRGDDPEAVRTNFGRFCRAVGVEADDVVLSAQEHGIQLYNATARDRGEGVAYARTLQNIDGLLTDEPGVVLCTQYADCVPLLFVDPIRRVVATAHAGWRGTAERIGAVTVDRLCTDYGCRREDILAAICPSIGPCCFEVDPPVASVFSAMPEAAGLIQPAAGEKSFINLWQLNRRILLDSGLRGQNITVTDLCTRCHSSVFWSHRATGPQRGSLAVMIALAK